jgi:SAM-dependent methyltransferase
VKSSIGSLDAAGGIAGLIKAVLALRHREIPPTLNRAQDPEGFDPNGPFRFADHAVPWGAPSDGGARVAGVHAYGLGGTNAHVVLEEHPDQRLDVWSTAALHKVVLSAGSDAALRRTRERLLAWLDDCDEPPVLADLAYTLSKGREVLPCRWRTAVPTIDALRDELRGIPPSSRQPPSEDEVVGDIIPVKRMSLREGQDDPSFLEVGMPWLFENPIIGRIISLPGHAFERPEKSVVGAFYDFVTQAEERDDEIFLTLAPLPGIVPGFSWTRTFQSPERHPEHWAMLQAAQREMREVLFSGVDFATVERALDFGCGVGTDLCALARGHAALQGVGYTISGRQAAIARGRVARAGLADRIEIHHRDSASDAFPGLFDLVFGFEVGHHIADKQALFGNIAGHLVPEGMLLLADCAANTVAPIILPEVGSFTSTRDEYAEVLAAHGLAVTECIDLSQEIANFLHDPGLEAMIAEEAARGKGDPALMAAVQRSWDGFGQALRSGLISYLLITARRRPEAAGLSVANRQHLGLS